MKMLVLLLVACDGGKSDPFLDVGSASSTPEVPGTTEWNVDSVSKSSPIAGNPTLTVIERAFRNQQPAWPLLSKDGETAVVALPTRQAPNGWLTFAVEYVGVNRAQPLERIPLIDASLMTTIHTALDTAAIAMADVKVLVKAARRINRRVAEEEFSRFDGQLVEISASVAGTFKIRRSEGEVVEVTRGDWRAETPKLPNVGTGDCVAHPVLRRVFFDNRRKRVLVHLGWEVAAATCALPDDRYYLLGP